MGCGGSKEAKEPGNATTAAADTNDDKPIPIKKVRTNFSDIHYDEPAQGRRDTTYAPSEIPESRRPTETGAEPVPVGGGGAADGSLGVPVPATVGPDGMLSPKSANVATSPSAPVPATTTAVPQGVAGGETIEPSVSPKTS